MKRRLISFLLVIVFAFGFLSCSKEDTLEKEEEEIQASFDGKYIPGTYEGRANGYGGEVIATVVLSADRIESITCTKEKETYEIGSVAIAKLIEQMVSRQSVHVDAVTGATVSSEAIKQAVTHAFTYAGVDVETLVPVMGEPAVDLTPTEKRKVDVVVIGAGGAGMTAALEAKSQGLDVIILEKQPYAGGNTVRATSGMNATETKLQEVLGVKDSVELFMEDTMKVGNDVNKEGLVRILAENSASGIEWLTKINAPLPKLSMTSGSSNLRTHIPDETLSIGPYIVDAMLNELKNNQVDILYNTKATKLVMEDGKMVGVAAIGKTKHVFIQCNAVILATGGFGSNTDLVSSYNKELIKYKATSSFGSTGDGILMAQEVGAKVIDMEQIQVHPTVECKTSTLITESVREGGAILVNQNGERFFNELSTSNLVAKAIMEQEGSYAYLIFDQQLRDCLDVIEDYISDDMVEEEDSFLELAKNLGIDSETLISTVAQYNNSITIGSDHIFHRTKGMDQMISKAPYYAIKVSSAVHYTLGGVEITRKAEVVGVSGAVIPGLYAAGEVTGGIHGENVMDGNAITELVVFGRIAGESAAEYIKTHYGTSRYQQLHNRYQTQ